MGGIAQIPVVARAMAVPSMFSEERLQRLRDETLKAALDYTGKPHEWRQRGDSEVWELVPRDDG